MLEIDKIYNMDCIYGMKKLDSDSINLIVTDPPYKFESRGSGIIKRRKYLSNIAKSFGSDYNPYPCLKEFLRLMNPFNLYIACNKELIIDYLNFSRDNNFKYDVLTWHKKTPIPTFNNHYLPDTEYFIYIRDKGVTFNTDLKFDFYRKHWLCDSPRNINHPSVKPLKIIKKLIAVSSNKDDVILDPYLGSGTTAVACRQLDRHFIAFEINSDYVEIANKRLMNIPKCLEYFVREDTNVSC